MGCLSRQPISLHLPPHSHPHMKIINIPFILYSFTCSAQSAKPVVIEGRNMPGKQMFFAAEIHSIDERWQFYESLCTYLVANNGIRNIIMEDGHAEAWLLNAYLNNNDTTYFHYFPKDIARRHFLDHLRQINSSLPTDRKLHIRGIDFERMYYAIAARQILASYPKLLNTDFHKYIYSLPDSMLRQVYMLAKQHQMRKSEYAKAQAMFASGKPTLKAELNPDDFTALQRIFENPNTEKKWARRDKGMYQNLQQHDLLNQPFLCIVGRYHTTYKRGELHRSLMKHIVKHNRTAVDKIAIIDEVRNGPYIEQHLFSAENAPQVMNYGTAGPDYFIHDSAAMAIAYKMYFKPQEQYTLVYKDAFTPFVKKDNHHLDSWYIFFGEPPSKDRRANN